MLHPQDRGAIALAAAIAAVLSATGPAAGNDAQAPLARSLDTIQITANRRPEVLSRAPRATSVTEPTLADLGARHTVAELLRGLPGVFVQQTTPGQGNAIVRGLKGSEVLHLVDGARMNMAIFRNAPNNYIGLVDPLAVERIEVVRGPASVLYGSDAMGGVVHVLTEGLDLDDAPGTRYRLQGGLATGDLSSVLRASASTVDAHGGVHAALFHQDVGQRRTGNGVRQPFSAFTARGGELTAARRLPGAELHLRLSRYEQPSTPRHDALVPGFGQDTPDNVLFRFEPNRRDAGSLRLADGGPGRYWDSAELQLGWQSMVDGRRTRDAGNPETVLEENASRMWSGSAVLTRAVGTDGILTFGADGYVDRVRSRRRALLDGSAEPRAPRFSDGSRMRGLGVFANHEWFPRDGMELVLGLRYSRFGIHLPASGAAPGVALAVDDFTGSVGFSVMLDPELQLVANLGRGFRAPNIFDLGNLGPRPGGRYNQPNPALGPESVVTTDLGLRYSNGSSTAEIFGFASWYNDRIVSVATGERTDAGEEIVQNRNIASTRFHGLEAALEHTLGDDTLLHATVNYTWGANRLPGGSEPADRVPPLNATLGLRHRLSPHWTLDFRAWAAGGQYRLGASDVVDPRIDPDGTPGFAAVGGSLTRAFGPQGSVVVRVDNIFDRRYREHGSGMDATGLDLGVAFDWRF